MKVKELIEELQKFENKDQDIVFVAVNDDDDIHEDLSEPNYDIDIAQVCEEDGKDLFVIVKFTK